MDLGKYLDNMTAGSSMIQDRRVSGSDSESERSSCQGESTRKSTNMLEVDRRKLYEISDEPQRKEFLDDLFSFMQKRGTPINRLPIMAKSVLDLYELYNLVIARGGLVEVINKKLWQEIIKGLRLPSSITSAAFTLRTQYMKYLYDYECEKKNLSTRSELDAAIEGNKREGRRASGQYDAQAALINQLSFLMQPQMNRVPVSLAQLQQHMQPLGLSLGGGVAGVPRMPPIPPHPPQELEYRFREYVKLMQQQQREMLRNAFYVPGSESPPSVSGPHGMVSREALNDVTKMTFWSLYNNNHVNGQQHVNDLEPQREALNLSDSPSSSTSGGKRERDTSCRPSPPPAKRRHTMSPPVRQATPPRPGSGAPLLSPSPPREGAHMNGNASADVLGLGAGFRIIARADANGGQQLIVAVEMNGMLYEGILFAVPANENNGQNNHGSGDGQIVS